MKSIQFVHNRKYNEILTPYEKDEDILMREYELSHFGGSTIAMSEVLVKEFDKLEEGDEITVSVGKAFCSNLDRYEKAVGRKLAIERMKAINLIVSAIDEDDDNVYVRLVDEDQNSYYLECKHSGKTVHFVGYGD